MGVAMVGEDPRRGIAVPEHGKAIVEWRPASVSAGDDAAPWSLAECGRGRSIASGTVSGVVIGRWRS